VIPAEQRSSSGVVKVRGDAQHKPLVDHDAVRVAAVGDTTQMLVGKIVRVGRIRAELFEARLALGAGAVGIDHAAHRGEVAGFELETAEPTLVTRPTIS